MKDWKSSVRNWIRSDRKKDKPAKKQSAYVDDMHARTEETRSANRPPEDLAHSLFGDE